MPLPLHDVTTLTEAFRRAVLRLFVRRELMDVETAQGMVAWPHSALDVSPHHHLGVSRCTTAARSLGSGVAGVRTCRLVALAVPDPGRVIGSRPLIGPWTRPEAAGGPPH